MAPLGQRRMRSSTSSTDSSVWTTSATAGPPDPLTGRGECSVNGGGAGGPVVVPSLALGRSHPRWRKPPRGWSHAAGRRQRIASLPVGGTATVVLLETDLDWTRTIVIAGALTLSFDRSVVDGARGSLRRRLPWFARGRRLRRGTTVRRTYRADAKARQRVSAVAAATIDTRWGRVGYVDQGDGVPVFLSHGVFGGHDNARSGRSFGSELSTGPSDRHGSATSALPCPRAPRSPTRPTPTPLSWTTLSSNGSSCAASPPGDPPPSSCAPSSRPATRADPRILLPSRHGRQDGADGRPPARAVRRRLGTRLVAAQAVLADTARSHHGRPQRMGCRPGPQLLAIRTSLFPVAPKRLGVAFDAVVSEAASNSFHSKTSGCLPFSFSADDRLARPSACRQPRHGYPSAPRHDRSGGHLLPRTRSRRTASHHCVRPRPAAPGRSRSGGRVARLTNVSAGHATRIRAREAPPGSPERRPRSACRRSNVLANGPSNNTRLCRTGTANPSTERAHRTLIHRSRRRRIRPTSVGAAVRSRIATDRRFSRSTAEARAAPNASDSTIAASLKCRWRTGQTWPDAALGQGRAGASGLIAVRTSARRSSRIRCGGDRGCRAGRVLAAVVIEHDCAGFPGDDDARRVPRSV